MNTSGTRRRGRPPGRDFAESVRVRLSVPVAETAREACKVFGVNMSQLIRAGVSCALAEAIRRQVAIADAEVGWAGLDAIRFLDRAQLAALEPFLSADDLQRAWETRFPLRLPHRRGKRGPHTPRAIERFTRGG